jgi:hypothetical protein
MLGGKNAKLYQGLAISTETDHHGATNPVEFQPRQFSSPLRHIAYMYVQNESSNISPFQTYRVKGTASLPGREKKQKTKKFY